MAVILAINWTPFSWFLLVLAILLALAALFLPEDPMTANKLLAIAALILAIVSVLAVTGLPLLAIAVVCIALALLL